MTTTPRRDPLVIIGLSVVAIAAAVSSFAALLGTAQLAGWSSHTAWLLPTTIDCTAMTATRVWLAASTPSAAARRFARTTAFCSIAVSVAGNLVFHLTEAHVIRPGVALVVAAGAVPPLALALVAHLAVLRSAAPAESAEASERVSPALGELASPQELTSPASAPLLPAPPVPALAVSADTTPDTRPDTTRTPARTSTRTDTASKIKRLRERHPDMSVVEIADKVGVTDRTVRRHLAAVSA